MCLANQDNFIFENKFILPLKKTNLNLWLNLILYLIWYVHNFVFWYIIFLVALSSSLIKIITQ